jgi:membrane protein required for colicin V production
LDQSVFAAFTWPDLVIIAIILISAIVSLFRGFIREALSLAVWILAFVFAFILSDDLAVYIPAAIETASLRQALAFGGIFLLVLIVGSLVNFLVAKLVDQTGLGATDRIIGMVFGLLRGALVVLLVVLLAALTPIPQDEWWQSSRLIGYFEQLAEQTRELLPEDIGRHIDYDPQPAGDAQAKEPEPIDAEAVRELVTPEGDQ